MKKNILFAFTGLLIGVAITIGVYAINANEITYNNTTVAGALTDLYGLAGRDISTGEIYTYEYHDTANNVSTYTADKDITVVVNCYALCHPNASDAYANDVVIATDGDMLELQDYSTSFKIIKGKLGVYQLSQGEYVSCTTSAYDYGRQKHTYIELEK